MDAGLELAAVFGQMVDGQGLHGERQVHDLDRVAVAARQVHQQPTAEQVQAPAVGQAVLGDVPARLAFFPGQGVEPGHVDLRVHAAGVGEDGAVFHPLEVLAAEDAVGSGGGDEEVAEARRLEERHHPVAVGHGFERAHRVHFAHHHAGVQPGGAPRQALPAPAVARQHHGLPAEVEVGERQHRREDRLAGAVAVVEEVLAKSVVAGDDGIGEQALAFHVAQLGDAGGGLLGGAPDLAGALLHASVQQAGELGAVVDQQHRAGFEHAVQVRFESFRRSVGLGEDGYAFGGHRGGDVVLDVPRTRARQSHARPGAVEQDAQVSGLGFERDADADGDVAQGAVGEVLLEDGVQHGRVLLHPADLALPFGGQGRVFDDGFRHRESCQRQLCR